MVIQKTPKTGPQRVAVLRSMQHPKIQQFFAELDAITDKQELLRFSYWMDKFLPEELRNIEIGTDEISWVFGDAVKMVERQLNAAEKAAKEAHRNAKAKGRETVVRERAEQAAAFRGANPELAAAIEEQKPMLAETYRSNVNRCFEGFEAKYGPELKGISNSRDYLHFVHLPGIMRTSEGYALDPVGVEKAATKYADAVAAEWLYKISGKMTRLQQATVRRMNGREFTIQGTVQGKEVVINQNMIFNRSPYGVLFNQFPARIYVDGNFMSELKYKKMLAVGALGWKA